MLYRYDTGILLYYTDRILVYRQDTGIMQYGQDTGIQIGYWYTDRILVYCCYTAIRPTKELALVIICFC